MPRRPASPTGLRARGPLVCIAVAASLLLSGCVGPESVTVTPSSSSTAAITASGSSPTATTTPPAAPAVVPGGSAQDNLPVFEAVTAAVWAGADRASGRAYIDGLVAAGFDKAMMQVTADQSTVGNPAESIQFAVRWGDRCLVGQVGPATGAPVTVVVPALAEGTCLVGATRPIDW